VGAHPPFRGWPPATLAWFAGIEKHNDREWFQANRDTYEQAVRQPFLSLLAEVADEFGDGKLFRPHRDTRFSADKRPYKTAAAASITRGNGSGGYYVHLERDGLYVGAGLYAPARDQLARARAAIADPKSGAKLATIVGKLAKAGLPMMQDDALKTAPKGYQSDHPRAELLRLVHLAAIRSEPVRRWLHTRGAKDRIIAAWRASGPLLEWLDVHVGPSELPGR
jgi:uncharacterized protein (TIGR02453 family)